jgi:hypothetical protein
VKLVPVIGADMKGEEKTEVQDLPRGGSDVFGGAFPVPEGPRRKRQLLQQPRLKCQDAISLFSALK